MADEMRRQSITGQLALFDKGSRETTSRRSSTFSDNLSLPVHRWFRYSAGFSALWVSEVIRAADKPNLRVLDPFAGAGTVPLEAEACGAEAIGIEAHPFVTRVASAKLLWRTSPEQLLYTGLDLLRNATRLNACIDNYPSLTVASTG